MVPAGKGNAAVSSACVSKYMIFVIAWASVIPVGSLVAAIATLDFSAGEISPAFVPFAKSIVASVPVLLVTIPFVGAEVYARFVVPPPPEPL